jgi:hypothetical protein
MFTNTVIEKLFKEAGGYIEKDSHGNITTYSHDLDPIMYAALIIKECAGIAHSSDTPSKDIRELLTNE